MPNDVLERLRRANPIPHDLPAPPIEPLLARLDEPGARPAARGLPGVVAVVLGVGVVVLVAAIMLGITGSRSPTIAGGVPPAAQQLVAELGVLRRPQTAADRDLPGAVLGADAVPSLTRLATRVGAVRVFVIVRLLPPSQTAIVSAVALTPGGGVFPLDSGTAMSLRKPAPVALARGAPVHGTLVPDGVAATVWAFRPTAARAVWSAVYSSVRGNIAVARFTHSHGALSRVTWYGAHEHVIASFNAAAASRAPAANNPVINDCQAHGVLTHSYATGQLRRALAVMPATVMEYTDCFDVIDRALLSRGKPPGFDKTGTSGG